jgi:hypothetical protein
MNQAKKRSKKKIRKLKEKNADKDCYILVLNNAIKDLESQLKDKV